MALAVHNMHYILYCLITLKSVYNKYLAYVKNLSCYKIYVLLYKADCTYYNILVLPLSVIYCHKR